MMINSASSYLKEDLPHSTCSALDRLAAVLPPAISVCTPVVFLDVVRELVQYRSSTLGRLVWH